jgi:hypothetical protein
MRLVTIALAIAFGLPSSFALAGPMNLGSQVTRPIAGAAVTRPIATRPRNLSGNALAHVMHDPSGSTSTPLAMCRGG